MQGRLVPREIKSRIQSFPYKNWRKELNIAKKFNIKIIEWTIDYKKFLSNPLISNPELVKLNLDKNKLKCNSVTADFFMQKPVWGREKNKSDLYLKKLIKSCEILKIKYIIIPLVDNASVIKKNKSNAIKYFISLKKKYLKKVKILFELDLNPNQVNSFLKDIGDSFGINYDTGNSASLGYKFDEEKKYFDKVHNIHIKDRKIKGSTVRLGKGNFNFTNFFIYIKKINYKKNLILQTYIPKKNSKVLTETLNNLEFIKKNYVK